jgi:hypothetical protein
MRFQTSISDIDGLAEMLRIAWGCLPVPDNHTARDACCDSTCQARAESAPLLLASRMQTHARLPRELVPMFSRLEPLSKGRHALRNTTLHALLLLFDSARCFGACNSANFLPASLLIFVLSSRAAFHALRQHLLARMTPRRRCQTPWRMLG